jgi:hypothetical protein
VIRKLVVVVAVCAMACGDEVAIQTPEQPSCATVPLQTSAAPLMFAKSFVVDTGLAPYKAIGATYGQPGCPHQLVVDVAGSILESDFSVIGGWSESVSSLPACSMLSAETIVYGRRSTSSTFQILDQASSKGVAQGKLCNPSATHTNPADVGSVGTLVPAGTFAELRVAVRAERSGTQVAVLVTGNVVP